MARVPKMSVPSSSIAYFSMEASIDPGMLTYSGGLGILAEDTPRAVSPWQGTCRYRLKAAAVKALPDNRGGYMVGEINREIAITPLKDTWEKQNSLHPGLTDLLRILSV